MNTVTPLSTAKKPQDFKNGHQVMLKTFIRDQTLIEIEFTDNTLQLGRVTQFDNYTITIMRVVQDRHGHRELAEAINTGKRLSSIPTFRDDGHRTYFKSCIKGFGAHTNV